MNRVITQRELRNQSAAVLRARVAVGIGEAALAPAAISMIADYFPARQRGTAIGVFVAGMALGGGAAISIGGALLDAANLGMLRELPVVLGAGITAIALFLRAKAREERTACDPSQLRARVASHGCSH
jgi:MFS family permease